MSSPNTEPKQILRMEQVRPLFERQAAHEIAKEKETEEKREEQLRTAWYMKKAGPRQFPNDASAREKRWSEERRINIANAKQERRSIQSYFARRHRDERRAIIMEGVLEGAIQIHETDDGFEIDTPTERVKEYLQQHPHTKSKLPKVEDLMQGRFLTASVGITSKE